MLKMEQELLGDKRCIRFGARHARVCTVTRQFACPHVVPQIHPPEGLITNDHC